MTAAQKQELESSGRVWFRRAIDAGTLDKIAEASDVGNRPGIRINREDEIAALFGPDTLLGAFLDDIGLNHRPVRLLAFNKSERANWAVPWHQDRVIAVSHKAEVSGYHNWVSKAGFWHCEPPLDLLRDMVFARVHIDPSTAANGALEIAAGSHRFDRVAAADASSIAKQCSVEVCEAEPGDVLLVKALALHRSSSAQVASPRRTLRADFAPRSALAAPLQWAMP
ncbi:MAG: phytanoyl-CoA dioxygenase family protein [Pseudomonadota bacterium]